MLVQLIDLLGKKRKLFQDLYLLHPFLLMVISAVDIFLYEKTHVSMTLIELRPTAYLLDVYTTGLLCVLNEPIFKDAQHTIDLWFLIMDVAVGCCDTC